MTQLRIHLDNLVKYAPWVELAVSRERAQEIRSFELRPDMTAQQALGVQKELRNLVQLELKTRRFLFVPNAYADYYESPLDTWGDVPDKFPSAAREIEEASKCLALGLTTACVLHLMRALEPPLIKLADRFNVSSDRREWGKIVQDVISRINSMGDDPNKPTDWKDQQEFFSNCATYFKIFKNAWRNHAMHFTEQYGAVEAQRIYEAVRGFMKEIGMHLREN